jgi:hypothetical protein
MEFLANAGVRGELFGHVAIMMCTVQFGPPLSPWPLVIDTLAPIRIAASPSVALQGASREPACEALHKIDTRSILA